MTEERYHVLARKWRPPTFSEVVGQEHVSRSLANALKHGRIHHAYLLCGPRGVGKTTIARILAKALNCENAGGPTAEPCLECSSCRAIADGTSMDVMEIDGASNNSVEQVRDLRETLGYTPAESRFRVIIIDEVHMLSKAAFNALLKTLEEPPAHVIFIFATTEANKVIPTVQSRCQRYDFHRLTVSQIRGQLQKICEAEGVDIEPAGLDLIAQRADGAMRDGESLLDQVTAALDGAITAEQVADLIGSVERDVYIGLMDAVARQDASEALAIVARTMNRGRSLSEFLGGLLFHLRHLLACAVKASEALSEVDERERERLIAQAGAFSERDIVRMLNVIAQTETQLNNSAAPQVRVELALLKLVYMERSVELAELMTRLDSLAAAPENGISESVAERRPPSARTRGPASRSRETAGSGEESQEIDEPEPGWGPAGVPAPPPEEPEPVPAPKPDAGRAAAKQRPGKQADARPQAPASIAVVKARWPEISEALREDGLPDWIHTQVTPVSLDGGELTITLKDDFHANRLKKEQYRVLEAVKDRFPDIVALQITGPQATTEQNDRRTKGPVNSLLDGVVQDEPIIGKLISELNLKLTD